eukprot:m.161934 g.161934  ORF g.161934 m.161934 type:complete len:463 (+) comp15201_c3_seq9:4294-5682(+)
MAKQESHVAAFYDKATLGSTREERQQDPTYQLKRYHNLVKRQLIQVCSRNVSYHLDIACGRGGDIDKWLDAGIRHVLGLDISPNEIESAHKRLKIIQERRRERADIRFRVETEVGLRALNLSRHDFHREYDSVSCMFSAHFFFASEPFFHHLLANVSSALRDRGFFYGTAASGPSVEALLADQPVFTSEFLHVRRHFAAAPAARAPATSNEETEEHSSAKRARLAPASPENPAAVSAQTIDQAHVSAAADVVAATGDTAPTATTAVAAPIPATVAPSSAAPAPEHVPDHSPLEVPATPADPGATAANATAPARPEPAQGPFGHGYTFALKGTVTENESIDREGCMEYLLNPRVFTEACAQYHLYPAREHTWRKLSRDLLVPQPSAVASPGFRDFNPKLEDQDLAQASRLFAAFVFEKVSVDRFLRSTLTGQDLRASCAPGCKVHGSRRDRDRDRDRDREHQA